MNVEQGSISRIRPFPSGTPSKNARAALGDRTNDKRQEIDFHAPSSGSTTGRSEPQHVPLKLPAARTPEHRVKRVALEPEIGEVKHNEVNLALI